LGGHTPPVGVDVQAEQMVEQVVAGRDVGEHAPDTSFTFVEQRRRHGSSRDNNCWCEWQVWPHPFSMARYNIGERVYLRSPLAVGVRGEREGGSPGPERTGKQRRRTTCSRRKDVAHAGSGSGSSSTRRPTATMCVSATR